MEKFSSKNFKILMIAVVVLLGVLVYGLNAGTSVFSNVFGTVSAPLLTAGTNTTEGAKEFLNLDGMSKEELKALYNDLSEENRKLREQLVDYYTLKDENASYENILSVKKAMPDLQLAAGSVVGRDPNDVFGDFTINCGSLAGVSVGDAVITETGVVGVVEEVYAARDILKAAGLRKEGVNIIACPTCGRTRIDLIGLASRVETALKDCKKPLTVAVMGCIVNGPGEAREADVGIAGGEDCGVLFVKGEMRERLPYDELLPALLRYVDAL